MTLREQLQSQIPDEETLVELFKLPGLRKASLKESQHHRINPSLTKAQQQTVDRRRYAQMERKFRLRLQTYIRQWMADDLKGEDLVKIFSKELYSFQESSIILGKRSAGSKDNHLHLKEAKYLHGQHAAEVKRFKKMIVVGKNRMPLNIRADLYALGSFSLYCFGFITQSPPGTKWRYKLSKAEHCVDCVRKYKLSESKSGLTVEELVEIGLPSEKCRCGHRCQCFLVREDTEEKVKRSSPTSFKWISSRIKK